MDSVRLLVNNVLDAIEAVDLSGISSFISLSWVRAEWFEWRNHYLPLGFILVFFYPVLLTLFMALTAASAWLFWLLTSLVFGVLQLIYVSYQFVMIFSDILILSLFKTYSMLRSQLLYYLGPKVGYHKKKSRRREWWQAVQHAKTYKEFLKIPVLETHAVQPSTLKRRPSLKDLLLSGSSDNKSSPLRRSSSFESSPNRQRTSSMSRNKSFADSRWIQQNNGSQDEDEVMLSKDQMLINLLQQEMGKTGEILVTTTARLREARLYQSEGSPDASADAGDSLKYLLSGLVKRNHLLLDEFLVENGRSVAESGKYGLSLEARNCIRSYYEEVERGLDWIAESPLRSNIEEQSPRGGLFTNSVINNNDSSQTELHDRISLIRKMKHNMGRTALMLSGGGAQAMYHAGTIRALIDSNLYDDIKVISGTSGGSITAAMAALKTPDELYQHVCVPNVSTDYMLTGEQKRINARWFPSLMEMGAYWLKHSLLVDSADFKKCCDFYYGDVTFEEAFEHTGKNVCITVSASRATGGTAQRLLLNHISTPHVTLASAVAASCALPGVMAPAKLLTKDSTGKQEPFEVDGVEWIDGSVQADLPFERISTLFNISNFIVCQTNFHVVPFLNKAHHPNQRSVYWRLFQTVEWDIRNRALKLSRLGLFPRIFGQDISKVFKQRYHGNLTLVPRFTAMQTFGLKALANPTFHDMENYLKYGQIAAWPYLNVISDMLRIERALDNCLARLVERRKVLSPDWEQDDLDSIASSSVQPPSGSGSKGVRFFGAREAERLKRRVMTLERENFQLKQQMEEMQRVMDDGSPVVDERDALAGEQLAIPVSDPNGLPLSEKEVWNLLRTRKRSQNQ